MTFKKKGKQSELHPFITFKVSFPHGLDQLKKVIMWSFCKKHLKNAMHNTKPHVLPISQLFTKALSFGQYNTFVWISTKLGKKNLFQCASV